MFKSKFLPVFTFLFITVLASCNFSANKYGSIFLDFTSLKGSPSASRNLIDTYLEEDKVVYADLTIDGLLDEPYTLNLMEKPYYEQDEIPVGTKIQVTVEAYIITNDDDRENSKYILYKGTSNKKTIGGGQNTIKILMKELTKKIYVRYDEGFQTGSWVLDALSKETYDTEDDEGNTVTITNDGKTPSTGFVYIQSAIDWIAENGNPNYDYEIILTGYDETNTFDQKIAFCNVQTEYDNLKGKAQSITLTSKDPYTSALSSNEVYLILASTSVPLIFKNIKISSSTASTNQFPCVLQVGATGHSATADPNVTLGYGTAFEGPFDDETYSQSAYGAVYVNYGTLQMEGNSYITGFSAYYFGGGAVFVNSGNFYMKDKAYIYRCTSKTENGGAIYSTGNNVTLEGSSEISRCTGKYGGAIFIKGSSLKIDGGSIYSCDSTNGGAVYIDATQSDTSCFISNSEIKENTADNSGSAVYLTGDYSMGKYAYLHLSDNAFIDPSNDIYLSDSASKVYLDSELTTDAETAALITLNSASEDSTIINCANANTSILENCFSKFCVNPTTETISEEEQIQHNWYINEEGQLKEVDYLLLEANAVQLGDLVFADNTRVRPEKYPYLTYQMRTSLAGIVFYAGTEDAPLGEVNLIVGTETMYGKYDSANRSSTAGHTVFDLTAQVSNFDITDIYPYVYETSSFIDISDAIFQSYALGNSSLNSTDTLNNSWAVIKDTVDSILQGTDTYYDLYEQVINYGNSFSESIYSIDTNDETNNWYIPTIYEYTLFYEAFNNETFTNIYNKKCGEMKNEYISATGLHYGNVTLPQCSGFNVLNFSIKMDEHIIRCYNTGNYAYCIPIHTYSL